jgi:hypothetical protein
LEKRSSSTSDEMSSAAQTVMREYAAFEWPTMNHKGRIAQLARRLGIGHRRVRSIYQNELGVSLRADEMAAIAALERTAAADEENRDAFMALQARVARLEAALAAVDAALLDQPVATIGAPPYGRRRDDEPGSSRGSDRPRD